MRKFLLPAVIIIAGITLGTIFSNTVPSNLGSSQKNSQTPQNGSVKASLSASPTTLKPVGENLNVREKFSSVEKSTLTVTYQNESDKDLSNVRLRVFVSGKSRHGLAGSKEAKYNLKESSQEQGATVFNVKNLKAKSSAKAELYLFSYNPASYKVQAEVVSTPFQSSKTNTVEISFK